MSILDDPTLGLAGRVSRGFVREEQPAQVRFRPGSTWAQEMGLPSGSEGVVTERYREDGGELLSILGSGWFATRVPAGEVDSY